MKTGKWPFCRTLDSSDSLGMGTPICLPPVYSLLTDPKHPVAPSFPQMPVFQRPHPHPAQPCLNSVVAGSLHTFPSSPSILGPELLCRGCLQGRTHEWTRCPMTWSIKRILRNQHRWIYSPSFHVFSRHTSCECGSNS